MDVYRIFPIAHVAGRVLAFYPDPYYNDCFALVCFDEKIPVALGKLGRGLGNML
jgi:hypothetical protein